MTKKDYKILASVIKAERSKAQLEDKVSDANNDSGYGYSAQTYRVGETAYALAKALALDNPNFSETKFLFDCGF